MANLKDHDSYNPSPEMLLRGQRLGAWYRAALKRAGTNTNQLSKKIGLSQSYLSDIEHDCLHGRVEPRAFKKVEEGVIRRIAEALAADLNAGLKAFGYDPEPAPPVPSVIAGLPEDSKHHLARLLESLGATVVNTSDTISIPILARVSAGVPLFDAGNVKGMLTLPAQVSGKYNPETDFAVQVVGSCLEGLHIIDGDMLICRQSQTAEDGDVVVVASDDEEAIAKRFRQEGRYRWLETVPGHGEPEIVKLTGDPRILGIQIGLTRNL